MDFEAFLNHALRAGTPLLFATLGEIITERSGKLNLGVEGMMLMGAVIGFNVAVTTSNPMLAILGAIIAGGIGGLIFAFLTVTLRSNQVVTGLTLTIFGVGFSNFVGKDLTNIKIPESFDTFFKQIKIPVLGDIKYIGNIFFTQDVLVYAGFLIAVISGIYLFRTRKGLNLRAIGENPAAADAAGINVSRYKYIHIVMGGALCGIGGAYLSLVSVMTWQHSITSGRGWIAVALVIFAMWSPYKAIIGAYLFGGLEILGLYLQSIEFIKISTFIIDMLPYIVTIIVLIITSMMKLKNSAQPKALGTAYFREER